MNIKRKIIRKIALGMITPMILGMLMHIPVYANPVADVNDNTLIYSFAANQYESPGYLPANEHEPLGPDAFYISGDRIFIDDTVNNRILVYDNGMFTKEILFHWNMDVTLLFYDVETDTLKVVYDDRNDNNCTHLYLTTFSVSTGEKNGEDVELSNINKVLLEYCFDTEGNLVTTYMSDTEKSNRLISPDLISNADILLGNEQNNIGSLSSMVAGISDNNSYSLYSGYSVLGNNSLLKQWITINNNGKATAFAVPETYNDEFRRGYLQFTETGSIYQMVADENGIRIYQLSQNPIESLEINSLKGKEIIQEEQANNSRNVSVMAAYKDMTTTTIKTRMDTYKNLAWTFNSSNNSNKSVTGDSTKVTQPSWLSGLATNKNHSVTNVPYCWGGWNAESFVKNINEGKFAGNVNTTSSGHVSGTVGMDCSGYVSVAFDLPHKHGTSTLKDCFTQISDSSQVKAYDILNKSGSHVRIVTNVYVQNNVRYVDYYEESTGSGKVDVKTGQKYQTILEGGYVPMRYDYLK